MRVRLRMIRLSARLLLSVFADDAQTQALLDVGRV
jgi:hypothetical protein